MSDTTGPIPYYLDILSKWPTAIPPESQWSVFIDFSSFFKITNNTTGVVTQNNFFEIDFISNLQKFDGSSSEDWKIKQNIVNNLLQSKYQYSNNKVWCVFASQITIPSESIQASNQGLDYAGYQAPVTMNQRDNYKKLSISFIETNSSFLDFVIRPWIISVGHYGFVTRSNGLTIKSPVISAIYLGKTGAGSKNKPATRKAINFLNACPVSMGSVSNRYSSDGLQSIPVEFVYDSYNVWGPSKTSTVSLALQ